MSLFHRHQWQARGVTLMEWGPGSLFNQLNYTPGDGAPFTEVVYVCSGCGKASTKRLRGHWTLEQLTP